MATMFQNTSWLYMKAGEEGTRLCFAILLSKIMKCPPKALHPNFSWKIMDKTAIDVTPEPLSNRWVGLHYQVKTEWRFVIDLGL